MKNVSSAPSKNVSSAPSSGSPSLKITSGSPRRQDHERQDHERSGSPRPQDHVSRSAKLNGVMPQ
nr:hypothetical protein Itr_chr13CG04950 [Ipomoea trifida]